MALAGMAGLAASAVAENRGLSPIIYLSESAHATENRAESTDGRCVVSIVY